MTVEQSSEKLEDGVVNRSRVLPLLTALTGAGHSIFFALKLDTAFGRCLPVVCSTDAVCPESRRATFAAADQAGRNQC